ncbi:hypothetical protein LR48_Vigan08g023000 [Vigna angularis]|uniref:Uncharacterized protein n=1 Tax=Phaseolus angularis TaxID=3914 RepID=A0A0L9V2Y1_PHAAN|nr:hypothetical protein LR48_Vigan08g023000 [Vigna angularis]
MVTGVESGGGARWWPASKAEGRRDGGDEYRDGGDGRLANLRRLASREDQAREDLRSGEVAARSGEVAARSGEVAARASCSGGKQLPFFPKSFLLP